MQIFLTDSGNGIYLCGAADSKRSEACQKRKNHSQPLHVQSAFQSIHGSPLHSSVLCLHTIFHCDQRFTVFGCYPKNTGDPAPENSTGSSQSHSGSHTDNISCANGRRQCGGQSAELTDLSFCVRIFCHRQSDCLSNLPLYKSCPYCHKNMSSKKQKDHPPSPNHLVDLIDHIYYRIKHKNLLFLF